MTDPRLLDCDSKPEIEENLNRMLALIDALEDRIAVLEGGGE